MFSFGVANGIGKAGSETVALTKRAFHAARRDVTRWVVTPVVVMWLIEVIDFLLVPRPGLDVYGIRPRSELGLWGIALAPWLHRGFAHLAANSVPLLVFGTLVLGRGARALRRVSLGIVLLGGLGVWLIGRAGTVHIGASGLVFGYLGYLLAVGWFERRVAGILVSVAVGVLYGGLLRGALPGVPGISWESHLCGCLAGISMARWSGRRSLTWK